MKMVIFLFYPISQLLLLVFLETVANSNAYIKPLFGNQFFIAFHSSFNYLNLLQSLSFLKSSVCMYMFGGEGVPFTYGFLPNR